MSAEPLILNSAAAFGVARSFSGQRWRLSAVDENAVRELSLSSAVSQALARLLVARNVTTDDVADYLNPTLKRFLPEPLTLKDMDKAVARTRLAIERGEQIAIFGDYDVDGSASAALLFEFLSTAAEPPRVYIPDRMSEGYGPNTAALLKLKSEGVSLVITVDCGAGAMVPLTAARDAGLDVVVLDHHAVEMPPPAVAHVNPNQSGDASGLGHVCAAGVTFLFAVALNRTLRDEGWYGRTSRAEPDLRELSDLTGLATICDVVPLTGVNRAFVRAGLAQMAKLKRPGLAALASIAQIAPPFTPYQLGFMFGPRINAGGRVGRSTLGVDLLIAQDPSSAIGFARELDLHNRERQAIEKLILEEAIAMAGTQANAPFLFVANEGWHPGVVGIVAGRLKDRFGKPSFVAGFEGGLGRGSARSISGVDIGAAVRAARERNLIESGGGHSMAAGFSLRPDQVEPFQRFLADAFAASADAFALAGELEIDAVLSPAGATVQLVDEIAQVRFADVVGKDHVRLRLGGGDGSTLDAIAFRTAEMPLGEGLLAARGKRIHLLGKLRADEWNGRRRVQLQVEDAASAEG